MVNDQEHKEDLPSILINTKNHYDQIKSIYNVVYNRYKCDETTKKQTNIDKSKFKPMNIFNYSGQKTDKKLFGSPNKTLLKTSSFISSLISPIKPVKLPIQKNLIEEFKVCERESQLKQLKLPCEKRNKLLPFDEKSYNKFIIKGGSNVSLGPNYMVDSTRIRELYRSYSNSRILNSNSISNTKKKDIRFSIQKNSLFKSLSNSKTRLSFKIFNDNFIKAEVSQLNKFKKTSHSWRENGSNFKLNDQQTKIDINYYPKIEQIDNSAN